MAFLIFLPNLLWNIHYHFPFLELQKNIQRSGRNVALPPLKFLGEEALSMLPLSVPVWLAACGSSSSAPGQALPLSGLGVAGNGRRHYDRESAHLLPFSRLPLLFAGGAIVWERWRRRPHLAWVKWSYGALMVLWARCWRLHASAAPAADVYPLRRSSPTCNSRASRTKSSGRCRSCSPTSSAGRRWRPRWPALTTACRPKCAPTRRSSAKTTARPGPSISWPALRTAPGHQRPPEFFLWGPRGYTGQSMIVLDDRRERLEELFTSCTLDEASRKLSLRHALQTTWTSTTARD